MLPCKRIQEGTVWPAGIKQFRAGLGYQEHDSVMNQVRNRLGMKVRWANHLWSQVVQEISIGHMSRKVRWDEGTTGRRDNGRSKPITWCNIRYMF